MIDHTKIEIKDKEILEEIPVGLLQKDITITDQEVSKHYTLSLEVTIK
jgi:hypothetical protein